MEKRKRCCCVRQLHHKKTGEGYGEKERQNKRKGIFSLVSFIFLWLFTGTILPNIMWKMKWQQKTVAAMYLLSSFSGQELAGTGLLEKY